MAQSGKVTEDNKMSYDPPRQKKPVPTGDPLEIDLVFNLTRCGTCSFFWPDQPSRQPYGPYPAFDFDSNTPKATSSGDQTSYAWLKVKTRPPSFPDPEIMDGCRKAPIMTMGINPNLTAFAPGRMGAAWCYPNFSSVGGTDVWTKYAYYYRYRSVYQERFDLGFISRYLLKAGQIVTPKAGVVVTAERPSDSPNFDLKVRYDGDSADTTIRVEEKLGEPRYVLLFDPQPPDNRFSKGDVIAAKLDVPPGDDVEVFRQQISYYEQFVPVLQQFENFLASKGHRGANLQIGEDVCQLDMVACASPHWSPLFLGGTKETESTIVHNCVAKNAWAIKQFVQTRPAVLFLVGESSYDMFRASFGSLIHPLPTEGPSDGAFTLLEETCDSKRPCYIQFSTTVDGEKYTISTRLVVTPHFSYNAHFLPQFRMSNDDWQRFGEKFRSCAQFLSTDKRIKYVAAQQGTYAAYQIERDPSGVLDELRREYLDALGDLNRSFCDAHRVMAGVLQDLCNQGALSYTPASGSNPGHLTRTDGSCHFCVNQHWQFPLGCPYEKTEEQAPPVGFLDKVAEAMVSAGALAR
jgi:hypothetical protein